MNSPTTAMTMSSASPRTASRRWIGADPSATELDAMGTAAPAGPRHLRAPPRAAPQVIELLANCPGLKVLATSRSARRLRRQHEVFAWPLALPEAPRAVHQQAQAVARRGDPL